MACVRSLCLLAATMVLIANTARAVSWDFASELTLYTQVFATDATPGSPDLLPDSTAASPFYGADASDAAMPIKGIPGINLGGSGDDVMFVGTRNGEGWGVGVQSAGGLALAGGYKTHDGIVISIYYVRRVTRLADDPTQDVAFAPPGSPDQTVGIRIAWRF